MIAKPITALGLLACFAPAFGQVCFTSSPVNTYVLGSFHADIIAADMNGDNHPDLITADYSNDAVSVMLWTGNDGGGNPQFAVPVSCPVGNEPLKLFTGDFDHDNDVDVVVSNHGANTVTVLLNDGAGNLAAVPYTVGNAPAGITGGDFNADGHLDLAVANFTAGTVSILYGSMSGVFTVDTPINTSTYEPFAIIAGDFDSDGDHDLALTLHDAGFGYYGFMSGNGLGGFSAPVAGASLTTTNSAPLPLLSQIDTADFNNDGRVDLALSFVSNQRKIHVLKSSIFGFPSAVSAVTLATSLYNYDLTCADYNGDGNADIAVILPFNAGSNRDSIKVILGKGDGYFPVIKTFSSDYRSTAVSITHADFNGDGKPDLATGNHINPNGTSSFDVYTLMNKTPWFAINGDMMLCGMDTTLLTASGEAGLTYTWYAPTDTQTAVSFNFAPTVADNYFTVAANNGMGCVNLSFGLVHVTTVDTAVGVSGGTLTALAGNSAYQWLGCAVPTDTLIPGATGQSYTPSVTGDYAVQITTEGCIDTSRCVSVLLASGIEGQDQVAFKAWPNPNNGQFYIEVGEGAEIGNITITDMMGKIVKEMQVKEKKVLIVLDQPAGIYFVNLNAKGVWHMGKIIVQ